MVDEPLRLVSPVEGSNTAERAVSFEAFRERYDDVFSAMVLVTRNRHEAGLQWLGKSQWR